MRWRTVPVAQYREHSEETKKIAHAAALKAMLEMKTEFVDVAGDGLSGLGKKWEIHFRHAYGALRDRFRDQIDDLILLAARSDKYTSVYEASLQHASAGQSVFDERVGDTQEVTCGGLLARHYINACTKELLAGTSFRNFPGTGDILEALSVDRIMQASLFIDTDPKRVLDLLADAMSAKFIATQGNMRLESFFALKNDRRANAKKVAASGGAAKAAKFDVLRKETIRLYKAGTWNDGVPAAAEEIKPQIVEFSKKHGPQLKPGTNKPLQWIRAYNKSLKK
jgi:hypothetical protein